MSHMVYVLENLDLICTISKDRKVWNCSLDIATFDPVVRYCQGVFPLNATLFKGTEGRRC